MSPWDLISPSNFKSELKYVFAIAARSLNLYCVGA
jgi:hypothetical protein